jgi:hypothetical protein
MSVNRTTRRRPLTGSRRPRGVKSRDIKARVVKNPSTGAVRKVEMQQAIEVMLAGDITTGKTILREYIKATEGFEKLSRALGTPAKSLIRMFGPRGNPQARNLFGVISYLQKRDGLSLRVTSGRKKRTLRRAA